MEQNPDGNQNQSQNEQSGKNEKEQNANIRVRGPRQHEVVDPEGYERDNTTCCQNHTNQTDRVLAQIVEQSYPIPDRIPRSHVGALQFFGFSVFL